MNDPFDDHVSVDHTPLFKAKTASASQGGVAVGNGGEGLEFPEPYQGQDERSHQAGLGVDLGVRGASLLELYFIDVGQGDGILIKTPDSGHNGGPSGPERSDTTNGPARGRHAG